jgi:CRP-like cAMP-binding protein
LLPGDCLGEMSLLTGDPRSATVVADGEVEALELSRAVFQPLVKEHPEILTRLSELLARRQAANQNFASAAAARHHEAESRASILRSLRDFFSLGD